MTGKAMVKVNSLTGPAYVEPTQIVAVLDNGISRELKFANGHSLTSSEAAAALAERLWGYKTEVGGGYINVEQIISVEEYEPNASAIVLPGLKVTVNAGSDMVMSFADLSDGLREAKLAL